ncbi:hypothetical protein ACGIF2_15860 [Cellulomonas sp. P22]|uniref:hypothetical protein n=1 Tax=Cellulomonas sp. P22 TaxID=3373189 RepID=UPI00378CB368
MIQVRTVYEAPTWRNMVDGLQQGSAYTSLAAAIAAGRATAIELQGTHEVRDSDGSLLERHSYSTSAERTGPGPSLYTP